MTVYSHTPRIARRLALLGVSTVLGATGLGTYLVVSASSAKPHLPSAAIRAAAAAPAKAVPAAEATAPDTDTIQQGDQSGPDQAGQH